MIRGIAFDLDDTLAPEACFVEGGFRAVAVAFENEFGPPRETQAILRKLFNAGDRRRVFNALLAQLGRPDDPDLVARMVDVYRAHCPIVELYQDAARAVAALHGHYALAVISDGFLTSQQNKAAALELERWFDPIVLTDAWGRDYWKPHPRAFEELAARWSISAAELAYVADNPEKDFVAPKQLGWRSIQIRRRDSLYGDRTPPAGGAADHVITTLDDLPALLR
ncbi:MAG: HAD family hydrolase [Phycisphaerae bacterium]|nr:HAD family hydrolase [Phycisphaerae bacterium]NUQ45883.1 HAD family hydrolase [Phycisphaerae bacterium]